MKTNISQQEAGVMLLAYLDIDFNDKIYEFAQFLCEEAINNIEEKHNIICDLEDNETWYDEFRNDFIAEVVENLTYNQN